MPCGDRGSRIDGNPEEEKESPMVQAERERETLSESGKVLPNFLIVGAAKAGTTFLYYLLQQHPEVFMPERTKEPSFFVHNFAFSSWDRYLDLFEGGRGKKAIGEASTAYLTAPESPQWINEKLEDVRIIILLRDPVERAYSLYSWMVMEGWEWAPTFERALLEEEKRLPDQFPRKKWQRGFFWNYMYFRSGLYFEQVKRYIDTFGRERVGVYLFEDLVAQPARTYADVCQFLGISDQFEPDFSAKNISRFPRSIQVQYFLRGLQLSTKKLPVRAQYIARKCLYPLIDLNVKWGDKKRLPSQVRKQLQEAYREDIHKLSKLIGRDLSLWLS
jgi:hypothetical protein